MNVVIEPGSVSRALPIVPVTAAQLDTFLATQPASARRWVESTGFKGMPATWCGIAGLDGSLSMVLVGVAPTPDLYALSHLPFALPEGDYALAMGPAMLDPLHAALGFALGAYQFQKYRKARRAPARLVLPQGANPVVLRELVAAIGLVRDLVNTPTEHMGPAELGDVARELAQAYGAEFSEIIGDELLAQNFPAIHAVGRASHRAPRLLEINWGQASHPRVALLGKGVCFDTGGLNIKPSDGMRWMKKDMGGAAHALGLARLIMAHRLPVRLQVLIPAVENAISANAYRPGEVIVTRSGVSVEIDNTDAEGRVVLGDAIVYAAESQPTLMMDFATLTGAARVALGPELPALFTNDDALTNAIQLAGRAELDPVWPMPLWQPYRSMLDSSVADMANAGASRQAGAITAALYLQRFVPDGVPWTHVDVYSWNDGDRPGRPRGGEAQSLRAFFSFLRSRFFQA